MGREARARKAHQQAQPTPSPRPQCADFDLAPLQAFSPDVLSRTPNKLDAYILALALAFNDLKGMMWMRQQLDNAPPESSGGRTAYLGQWMGMRLQCSRFSISILNEVLAAIKEASRHRLHDSPAFEDAFRQLSPSTAECWRDLV